MAEDIVSTAETTDSGENRYSLQFRTGASMLRRLGQEQLKDEITAVLELVKNAYDADATRVEVEFDLQARSLLIRDDGSGMSLDDLHKKWAQLATENKVRIERSPRFRRPLLGQKGVGRFAAEKLGRDLVLRTRIDGANRVLHVKFPWDQLEADRDLADYTFPIKRDHPRQFEPNHGTALLINNLRASWGKKQLERLRGQLATLIDPEIAASDFIILLKTPFEELNGELSNPLLGRETHSVEFELQKDGTEKTTFNEPKSRPERAVEKLEPPLFGPLRGRICYFGKGLPKRDVGRGGDTDADWNVGVRIFRDGCRVRPYGEPGPHGDWLQIYRTRYVKGSRFRLKPHYLAGTIHITKRDNPELRDTTSREGLDENDSYQPFLEYITGKVLRLSDAIREDELREERSKKQERYKRALDPLTAGLNSVRSEEYRRAVEASDKQVQKSIRGRPLPSTIRNAHWECLDCQDSWKVPRDRTPARCREYSVTRDDRPTNKPGCGSRNIRRKENVDRDGKPKPQTVQPLDDIMAGIPAYVSGIQVKPTIDWEMGEADDEAEVRPDRRELAINGRHPAFRTADRLDGNETVEGTALEELRAVAALTMHVIDSASVAWGRWHYKQSNGQFDEFMTQYSKLKSACLGNVKTCA